MQPRLCCNPGTGEGQGGGGALVPHRFRQRGHPKLVGDRVLRIFGVQKAVPVAPQNEPLAGSILRNAWISVYKIHCRQRRRQGNNIYCFLKLARTEARPCASSGGGQSPVFPRAPSPAPQRSHRQILSAQTRGCISKLDLLARPCRLRPAS